MRKKGPKAKAARKSAKQKKKAARKKATRKKAARQKKAARKKVPRKQASPKAKPTKRAEAPEIASRNPERIGTVRHYYSRSKAGIIEIDRGELHAGDVVHFRGHTTDFFERIEHIELDAKSIDTARAGDTIGIELTRTVRENDAVYLLST